MLYQRAGITKEEVVGYEFLKTYGGEVKIIGLLSGKSTSSIIKKTAG